MKQTYIVTGANGFLGNTIVRKLAESEDNEIRALVLPGDSTKALDGVRCTLFYGDVTQPDTLQPLFDVEDGTPLYVIHCAALVSIKSRHNPSIRAVNVTGTRHVIEQTLRHHARLVYVSSVHAIPEKPGQQLITETEDFHPDRVVGEYAKSKAEIAGQVLRLAKDGILDACIVHPSGIIGPGDFGNSHLTQMVLDFVRGKLRACVHGGYDFVDVRDVADGILSACHSGRRGACYILANRYISVRDMLDTIADLCGIRRVRTTLPMWLARAVSPLAEAYYAILRQPPLFTSYSLYTLRTNANFSSEKARRALGYRNRDFSQTLKDTLDWLKAQGRLR